MYASGTAPSALSIASGQYGGTVIAYNYDTDIVYFWIPNDATHGCMSFAKGMWGNGASQSCSQENMELVLRLNYAVNPRTPGGDPGNIRNMVSTIE